MKQNSFHQRLLAWIDRKHRSIQKFYYKDKFIHKIFFEIWDKNTWTGAESTSGPGSSLDQTKELIKLIPTILSNLKIKTFLDIPCGDLNWMQHVRMEHIEQYIGADIVPDIVQRNQKKFSNKKMEFKVLNLISDNLGKFDMIFIRDGLVHLSFEDIFNSISNLKKSKSLYLFTTTFPKTKTNEDIISGYWRPLNLQKPPFNFPKPILLVNERCTEVDGAYGDKSMAIWKIKDLP